jgi:hypothetical protein
MSTSSITGLFVGRANARSGHSIGLADLMMEEAGAKLIQRLVAFKASQRKDDPERRHGIHGPYEEIVLMRTGSLPIDYYEEGDDVPWGLRVAESRSGILWQVLSGILDYRPEFAAAYMGVAMDLVLDDEMYEKELRRLNSEWSGFNQSSRAMNDHAHHSSMRRTYSSMACPACSVLTAMVCEDEGMNRLFQSLKNLSAEDRREFLEHHGFGSLLNVMIPEPDTEIILNEYNVK